jgi:hypothetical protein
VSQICASGPLPFFCHQGIPWQERIAHELPARMLNKLSGGRLRVCQGWKRAVAQREWPGDPFLRAYQRMLARQALVTADAFLTGWVGAGVLQLDLSPLAEYYRGPRAWQLQRMVERQRAVESLEVR